jgi:hypothetical protein
MDRSLLRDRELFNILCVEEEEKSNPCSVILSILLNPSSSEHSTSNLRHCDLELFTSKMNKLGKAN